MAKQFNCWKCGAPLNKELFPLSRRDECPGCTTELHVCRMCIHFDPKLISQCRHDYADPPREKNRANFCDYFKASTSAFRPPDKSKSDVARDQLAELFGEGTTETQKNKSDDHHPFSEEQAAKKELERLFGLNKDDSEKN